jgi:hypothetical protein
MSCDECARVQNEMEYVSYVRVGAANVMIVGCKEHLKKLLDMYNFGVSIFDKADEILAPEKKGDGDQ